MTLSLGVMGFSEGNGHPYSFSAIVNGYDDAAFGRTDWDGIHTYLRARSPEDFGFAGVRVSSCWMPDATMARRLASACGIKTVVAEPNDMLGQIDAVMILRDDADSHWALAEPFLRAGIPVFVDKPLCADRSSLERFEPWLRTGLLMSCSGLRFAGETDDWRKRPEQFGEIRLIRGAVVMDWTRYGLHMLEAAMGALPGLRPVAIQRHAASHESFSIRLENGSLFLVDALGETPKSFRLDVFGSKAHSSVEIGDNFTAFRRTIAAFIEQVRTGRPAIDPEQTLLMVRTLIAGRNSQPGAGEILID